MLFTAAASGCNTHSLEVSSQKPPHENAKFDFPGPVCQRPFSDQIPLPKDEQNWRMSAMHWQHHTASADPEPPSFDSAGGHVAFDRLGNSVIVISSGEWQQYVCDIVLQTLDGAPFTSQRTKDAFDAAVKTVCRRFTRLSITSPTESTPNSRSRDWIALTSHRSRPDNRGEDREASTRAGRLCVKRVLHRKPACRLCR